MHKGFKCLDVTEGRVYISRDVIFDEDVFPFAKLHPNVGARLRSEILLLPPHLLNSSSGSGDNITSDPFGNDSLPTDALQHADPLENSEPNEPNSSNNWNHFMSSGAFPFFGRNTHKLPG
jgi:hypothetical protein